MSNGPEDFEKLQKLLKLKRHEQPPPGYFNNFSTKVITRIERNQDGSIAEINETPWLRRLFMVLETNPFAAGIFGVSICALLISGIAWSQQRPVQPISLLSGIEVADNNASTHSAGWAVASSVDSFTPAAMPVSNTNGSLFSSVSAQPVSLNVSQ